MGFMLRLKSVHAHSGSGEGWGLADSRGLRGFKRLRGQRCSFVRCSEELTDFYGGSHLEAVFDARHFQ